MDGSVGGGSEPGGAIGLAAGVWQSLLLTGASADSGSMGSDSTSKAQGKFATSSTASNSVP